MHHAPCRQLPFHGKGRKANKLSCKIISSNLATWMHGILPDLWRGGMGILLHGTHASLNSVSIKRHCSVVTYFCITHVKQIIVCVQDWQACNLVYLDHAMPALVCVRSYHFATSQARKSVFMHVWLSLVMTNTHDIHL